MLIPPVMTWLLVSTSPDELSTIPVPAIPAFWWPETVPSPVLTSTNPGSTVAANAERSTDRAPDDLAGSAAGEGAKIGVGW